MVYTASNHVRLAIVSDIDHDLGVAYTRWVDQGSDDGPRIPIPHPYAGSKGEGIFIGLQVGSIVALDMTSYERYIPVCVMPYTGNYGDISSTDEASFDNIGFPTIESGDVILQGVTGSQISLTNDGNLTIINSFNEGKVISGEIDDSFRCAINVDSPVEYTVSHGGLKAFGIIRRDIRIEDEDEDFADFMKDVASEAILEEVGRNPTKQISYISGVSTASGASSSDEKSFRNPAFIEDRQIILEYGRNWVVGTYKEELSRLQSDLIPTSDFEYRRERRSNVLSLSLTYPNELIERVSGTLVDVFGNILDINKNIIAPPSGKDEEDILTDMLEKTRHSVAYHMEINTRKGFGYREEPSNTRKPILLNEPPDIKQTANNARDRSRWSVRVDKEGLTAINIPATSETGNIPFLARSETSSVLEVDEKGNVQEKARELHESKELFRNEKNQDIFLDQFGPGGISVSGVDAKNRLKGKPSSWKDEQNQQVLLPENIQAGTAFHDITKTALAVLEKDINKKASDIFSNSTVESGLQAVSSVVNASVPSTDKNAADRDEKTGLVKNQPNAGGRSLQLNLDGSLETSIGANTVDRIAWTIDTAGALVARLGRDRQGRSAIIHTDGYVVMEVGGWDFVGDGPNDQVDTRFVGRGDARENSLPGDPTRFRSGKVVIRIRRANRSNTGPDNDGDDQLLIIDDSGITIKSVGQLNLVSDGDMTIKSNSQLLLDGEVIRVFENNSRFISKSGRRIV